MNRRLPAPLSLLVPFAGAVLVLLILAGCGGTDEADAYGNFEATEVTVSAQAEGRLLTFLPREGQALAEGVTVGTIDTTQLAAQQRSLVAQRQQLLGEQRALGVQARAAEAQVGETDAAASALAIQLATAEEELARTRRLFADGAATARERNEREGLVAQLRAQTRQAEARIRAAEAQAGVPAARARALGDAVAGLDAQLIGLDDRLANASIVNPQQGVVLSVVAAAGELVRTGSPLYTIARLDTLTLRAFATGDQLPRLRLGMPVDVRVDDGGGGLRTLPGIVTFVAPAAQFTPTPIQTRAARAELVYAFDVRVPNPDGLLKIGMPGEVSFQEDR